MAEKKPSPPEETTETGEGTIKPIAVRTTGATRFQQFPI